jgi:predicted nuclease with TOPRIM domain
MMCMSAIVPALTMGVQMIVHVTGHEQTDKLLARIDRLERENEELRHRVDEGVHWDSGVHARLTRLESASEKAHGRVLSLEADREVIQDALDTLNGVVEWLEANFTFYDAS